jgi:ABC-type nitrate/sulfonate/bicarbonate transport system permease component
MSRRLSPNRRIAAVLAAAAGTTSASTSLLASAHTGISDFARGFAIGLSIALSIGLVTCSFVYLKRDHSCSSSREE